MYEGTRGSAPGLVSWVTQARLTRPRGQAPNGRDAGSPLPLPVQQAGLSSWKRDGSIFGQTE